ncbi:unnamed protein product [Owenia fusiformis]|uniref:Ig-like domain-containing protein n=1 Tax=Owenia fusiformis TaxID=6347 RepID=A0A8S4P3X1_OWEFU|nr:unnamed protein product [Owenia fusiformis]
MLLVAQLLIVIATVVHQTSCQQVGRKMIVYALAGDIVTLPCDIPYPSEEIIAWFGSAWRNAPLELIYTNVNNPNREVSNPRKYSMDTGDSYNMKISIDASQHFHYCAVIGPNNTELFRPNDFMFITFFSFGCPSSLTAPVYQETNIMCQYRVSGGVAGQLAWYNDVNEYITTRHCWFSPESTSVGYGACVDLFPNQTDIGYTETLRCTLISGGAPGPNVIKTFDDISCFTSVTIVP